MHNVEIFGLSLGGYFFVAAGWIVVWFIVLRMDDDTFWIPLLGSLMTAWVFGTVIPSMWAGFVAGMSGLFAGLGSIGTVILWLLGIAVVGFLGYWAVIGTIEYFRRRQPPPKGPVIQRNPARQPTQFDFLQPYQIGTDELYHGTSMDAAVRIFSTQLWMVGTSHPPGIWMSPDLDVARYYAEQGELGAIIVVKVHPSTQLVDKGGKILHFPIDGAIPNEEFYRVDALTPIRVLDVEGRHIM